MIWKSVTATKFHCGFSDCCIDALEHKVAKAQKFPENSPSSQPKYEPSEGKKVMRGYDYARMRGCGDAIMRGCEDVGIRLCEDAIRILS